MPGSGSLCSAVNASRMLPVNASVSACLVAGSLGRHNSAGKSRPPLIASRSSASTSAVHSGDWSISSVTLSSSVLPNAVASPSADKSPLVLASTCGKTSVAMARMPASGNRSLSSCWLSGSSGFESALATIYGATLRNCASRLAGSSLATNSGELSTV